MSTGLSAWSLQSRSGASRRVVAQRLRAGTYARSGPADRMTGKEAEE